MKRARGKTKAGSTALIGLFIMMSLLIPGYLSAETDIAVEDLGQIRLEKTRLWSPGRLAVGGDGTLYVVDSYKNRILLFDQSGSHKGDISSANVSAVAVAADGTLYVGSHASYSVAIIKSGRITGYLGNGENEFKSIRDIAVDPAGGTVYVADNAGNAVRIFDASGKDLGQLAGIHIPIAVAVSGEEIYVLDAPVIKQQGGSTTASRISVFDRTFNLLRTIDDYGKEYPLYGPTDIEIHGGIIYISDASLNAVVLYDTAGAYLGRIQSGTEQMYAAVSLALSSDGRLYVSASETHSVHAFSVAGYNAVQPTPGAGAAAGGRVN